jgi:hypothetical protein
VDKPKQLLLEALSRAAAEPAGVPLHSARGSAGLFNGTPIAKEAARRGLDQGYFRLVHAPNYGANGRELCTITDKGFAYLLAHHSPKQVLQDMVRVLEARQEEFSALAASTRQAQATLEAIKHAVESVLKTLGQPNADLVSRGKPALLALLDQWQASRAAGDCPLPELFRLAQPLTPHLSIGQFHDEVRRLHDEGEIYLHPWTGPLYDLPEPAYAMLAGHEIVYYASSRANNTR